MWGAWRGQLLAWLFLFLFSFSPHIQREGTNFSNNNNNLVPLFPTGVDNGEKVATQKVARNNNIISLSIYIDNVSADGRPAARLFFYFFLTTLPSPFPLPPEPGSFFGVTLPHLPAALSLPSTDVRK